MKENRTDTVQVCHLTQKGRQSKRNGPDTLKLQYGHGLKPGPKGTRETSKITVMSVIKKPWCGLCEVSSLYNVCESVRKKYMRWAFYRQDK